VAYSPDGRTILSGSWDHILMVWDTATGQMLRRFEGHTEGVTAVAYSPDGRTILSGSANSLRFWRIDSLDELLSWTRNNRDVPELTCDQRKLFHLEPPCDASR
jgi:WD40 repeat protein